MWVSSVSSLNTIDFFFSKRLYLSVSFLLLFMFITCVDASAHLFAYRLRIKFAGLQYYGKVDHFPFVIKHKLVDLFETKINLIVV